MKNWLDRFWLIWINTLLIIGWSVSCFTSKTILWRELLWLESKINNSTRIVGDLIFLIKVLFISFSLMQLKTFYLKFRYLISNLILRPLSLLSTRYFCSTNFLRATNVLFGIGLYLILWKLTIKLHPFQDRDLLSFNTLTLSIFPVGWFYNFLYYTDSGSTFFVLWSYLLSVEERYWMSALVSEFSFFQNIFYINF